MVAFDFVRSLQNIWPFSVIRHDDLRESNELVRKLSIPESTKSFVYAVSVPEHQSIVYILSVQSLSERSVADVECLIKEVCPDAVVANTTASVSEIQLENELADDSSDLVPTSVFEVLKRCFIKKLNKETYEDVAGELVLREIFGTTFHGHLLAAKRTAKKVGSSFVMLDSPFVKISSSGDEISGETEAGATFQGLVSSLVPQNAGSAVFQSSKRFVITDEVQSQMLKLLSSHIDQFNRVSNGQPNKDQSSESDEVPTFAQSVYPLLVDLHNIFADLPFAGQALSNARKMLSDINRGEVVDTRAISELYIFRVAIEGLRIARNYSGRVPIKKAGNSNPAEQDFSQLSIEDKSYAHLADVIKNQAKTSKTIVAVVDARNLGGLRKHWHTPVPREFDDLLGHLGSNHDNDEKASNSSKLKQLLSGKPVVAVGAGASAIIGASSLSKAVPASTFLKVITFKVPTSLHLFLTQTHKVISFSLSKILGSSKIIIPGAKSSSVLKASVSAEKIRAVTHGILTSAEKTSFSAMRTAFYEIMRKRRARPVGVLPMATFGCSAATCAGLILYGDGIECVVESLPSAPSMANLGRGIRNLRVASDEARQNEGNRIQKSIESLMHRWKKI